MLSWGGFKKDPFGAKLAKLANVLKWPRLIPNDQSNLSLATWDHFGPICIVWNLFGPKSNFASRTQTASWPKCFGGKNKFCLK